jgi:hypothetical protein
VTSSGSSQSAWWVWAPEKRSSIKTSSQGSIFEEHIKDIRLHHFARFPIQKCPFLLLIGGAEADAFY